MRSDPALWKRLGLDAGEWEDCRRTAQELKLLDPSAPTAEQVALEFALTKAFDVQSLTVTPTPVHASAGNLMVRVPR